MVRRRRALAGDPALSSDRAGSALPPASLAAFPRQADRRRGGRNADTLATKRTGGRSERACGKVHRHRARCPARLVRTPQAHSKGRRSSGVGHVPAAVRVSGAIVARCTRTAARSMAPASPPASSSARRAKASRRRRISPAVRPVAMPEGNSGKQQGLRSNILCAPEGDGCTEVSEFPTETGSIQLNHSERLGRTRENGAPSSLKNPAFRLYSLVVDKVCRTLSRARIRREASSGNNVSSSTAFEIVRGSARSTIAADPSSANSRTGDVSESTSAQPVPPSSAR